VYDLYRVQLPKRFPKCVDDEKLPGNHACEYPSYGLDKLISGKFARSGSPALRVIRNFKWSSADQNFVANLIAGKKMAKDRAAEQWVKKNAAKVNAWLK
jgi:glycine betaine/proline transport system substrate-binding protein